MKKIALLLVAVVLIFSASCGNNDQSSTVSLNTQTKSEPLSNTQTKSEPLSFGQSISTKIFKFTPSFDGFAKELANWPDENFLTPTGQISGSNPYEAADGKVMMFFSGTVEYIGDSKQNETFSLYYIVDYDNGYTFNGNNDYNASAFESEDARYHTAWGNSVDMNDWDYSNSMTFAPLSSITTRIIRFAIEVPEVLQSATDKPLNFIFTIDDNDYCFKVR